MEAVLRLNRVAQPINIDLSFEELKEVLDNSHLAMKVKNLSHLILKFFKRLDQRRLEQINDLCVENETLRQQLQEQLNIPETITLEFKHGELTNQSFAAALPEVHAETIAQIKLFDSFKLRLRRHTTRVFSFCEPQDLETSATSWDFVKHSKKFLTTSLSIIAFVSAVQTTTMKDSFHLSFPNFSWEESVDLPTFVESMEEVSVQFQKAQDPALKEIGVKITQIDFQKINALKSMKEMVPSPAPEHVELSEDDAHRITEIIASFYRKANPQRLAKIRHDIPVITNAIINSAQTKQLDYKTIISLMKVESDFRQNAASGTGDFSVAQINYNIWAPELMKEKKIKLNKEKLKTDITYSITMMGEILSVLKKRHKSDPLWFARYHNSKPSLKMKYAEKVLGARAQIEASEKNILSAQIKDLIKSLKGLDVSNPAVAANTDQIQHLIKQLAFIEVDIEKSKLKNQLASR